jgi:hypothetical protein
MRYRDIAIFLLHEDEPHFSLTYSFLWDSKDEQMSRMEYIEIRGSCNGFLVSSAPRLRFVKVLRLLAPSGGYREITCPK